MLNNRSLILRGIVTVAVLLAITGGAVFAFAQFTRDVAASVNILVMPEDGIEVYLDESLTEVAEFIEFGTVEVDFFGTVGESPSVPVWVKNHSLSTIGLSLDDDYGMADVVFKGVSEEIFLEPGEVFAGELTLSFHQGGEGTFNFTIFFNADGPIEPPLGGTLVTMETGNLQAIDFHRARSIGTMQWFSNIHLNLLEVDTQTRDTIVGDAAQSWEVSGDGTEWTFNIRPGLVTHKGMPFNSEDVRYNMQRWLDQPNDVGLLRSGCFRNAVIGVEAPNNDTVVVTTGTTEGGAAPNASFLKCVSQAYLLLQPKHIMTPVDAPGQQRDITVEEVDGIGPFVFTEYVPNNIVKSVRFDNYYEPELPYLDGYNMAIIPDAATRIAAFRTQLADFFPTFSTPRKPEADALVKQYGDKITYVRVVAPGKRGIIINNTRPPFDDPEIRWAMHLAIDRNAVNALHHDGVGFLAAPYLGLWDWIYSFDDYYQWPGFRSYPNGRWDEDLAESKRLLESKGFGPDNRLQVNILAGLTESDEVTIGDGLGDSYIDVTFDRQSGATRLERSRARDFDAFFESKGTEFDDPDAYNGLLYIPSAGINFTGWEDERWLELNELQKVELDQNKRGVLLREMADIIFDAQIFVGAIRPRLNQINWSYMEGYVHPKFTHQSTYRWDHIWLDFERGAPSR